MEEYKIIYEKSKDGYSAYVPDLPGCISVAGADLKEVKINIREAIELRLEILNKNEWMSNNGNFAPLFKSYPEIQYIDFQLLKSSMVQILNIYHEGLLWDISPIETK